MIDEDDYTRKPIRRPHPPADTGPRLFDRSHVGNGRDAVTVPHPIGTSSVSGADRVATVTMPSLPWGTA
jgi:hypothetical protein